MRGRLFGFKNLFQGMSILLFLATTSWWQDSYQTGFAKVGTGDPDLLQVIALTSTAGVILSFVPFRYLFKPLVGIGIYLIIGWFLERWQLKGPFAPVLKGTVYYSSVAAMIYCALFDVAHFTADVAARLNRKFSPLRAPAWAESSWNNTAEKGAALEEYVCELYRRIYGNAMTTTEMKKKGLIPNGPGDQGADVVVELPGGRRLVIQCKNYSSPLGNDAVQEVMAARAHYRADELAIVAPNGFTPKCIELAKSNAEYYEINIDLIDAARLDDLIGEANERRRA